MADLLEWWNSVVLPPTVVPVAFVCSIFGTVILAVFMRWQGVIMLVVSFVILFAGAYLGNVLTANFDIHLNRLYVRPVFMSIVGILAAALVFLILFPKNDND
ncbi:hypothetical protein [Aestuariivirga sp.]|uniref:hypothetical protein n=1 Tax=Aestuariivirga sp. TaxID=2650926 RepID=UPI0025C0D4ED|nr:hypothetical protein [Aestuariivirga sp.]MCA3554696.1 hypothetical protein [Aestuariivirga sp.]